ncbi:hypothetical protein LTR84_005799 [Exophiala bonariae]|uniref:FAD-binding PCMH-type domain-containing protein n=1 Tax=Exophiala bonariae TaxID=1690606 RepID=A0AAV9N3E6_9EURO|nr:hypothetical protein LTR84_005799 [Exophiala bonariae]
MTEGHDFNRFPPPMLEKPTTWTMASVTPPGRYNNFSEAHERHRKLFDRPLLHPWEDVLPPGVDQKLFDAVINELVELLGSDGVFVGKALVDYVDPFELSEAEGKRRQPSAAVCPRSLDEIKGVLQIANKNAIPLWTFSRGKNLGYGGPAPILQGSLIIDLHRLGEIIEVNEEFAYAVVEPGVTFKELFDHCVESKLKVWPSAPSLPWGSVIGNTLDRGMGFLPTGVHSQQIAGLEVLLANGDVVRTGHFANSKSKSGHLTKHSFGPSIEGLFLQSNLGIVTKLGIWLTPQPHSYMMCNLSVPDMKDVKILVDLLAPMRRNGLIPGTVWACSGTEVLAAMHKRAEIWKEPGPIPHSRLGELLKEFGMGLWNAMFGLYGPKSVVEAQFNEIKAIVENQAPVAQFRGNIYGGKDSGLVDVLSIPELDGGMWAGVPNFLSWEGLKWNLPLNSSASQPSHRDYAPIIPANGDTVLEWAEVSRRICEEEGFDIFCDFFILERHVIFVYLTTFDKADLKQRKAMKSILSRLHEEGEARGYAPYRCHIDDMDRVSESFDFNNHAYRRFVENLKDTFDPQGILSPGKSGIWGKRFRETNGST